LILAEVEETEEVEAQLVDAAILTAGFSAVGLLAEPAVGLEDVVLVVLDQEERGLYLWDSIPMALLISIAPEHRRRALAGVACFAPFLGFALLLVASIHAL